MSRSITRSLAFAAAFTQVLLPALGGPTTTVSGFCVIGIQTGAMVPTAPASAI
ncbi:hypothetical protein AZ22_1635 [Bordetella bronchiseptica 980-2]|nr:hypothetical protein AZ22_1635 [Bordetella bronchiseptica 980-2]KCV31435.1 hypothetical protein L489_1888 [Bordetella bronchiseptica 00-P-2730]KCV53143.1 hypothetical protein L491_1732 [Bordetella bronchiseptica 3E44]KCV58315.1 hypothetical protein AZ14_1715 [Bordetella bronchiseptica 980]KDB74270.1 hypothetical protein AZ21_1690 [Bordetella bronchiseptica B20-10725633]KDD54492.1 hypothetical protein L534_1743 [Bordetella bronchiseptica RB630]KDD61154.1 hypothetical protein L533_1782 [Bord